MGGKNCGCKIYVVVLNGSIEIETTDGECQKFYAGDVILPDDQSGKGHNIRTFERSAGVIAVHLNE